MKVLHVSAAYPTQENPQSGSFIFSQVVSLIQQGVESDVYVLKGHRIFKYLRGIFSLKKLIRNNNYNLIHAHYMYAGWTARLSSNLPLVISFMGNDVFGNLRDNGKYRFASKYLHNLFSNILLSYSSIGIAKSNNLAILLKNKNKIKIIPNGVDVSIFYPNKKIKKCDLGLSDRVKYVLFAGNPEEKRKRFTLANEAFNKLKEKIENVELLYIIYKKPVEVAAFLNACDCLLMTSNQEGSPNIVKEALACNLPVISIDVGDVAERINGVDNCYLTTTDPNDIARKLYKVIFNSQRAINGFEKVSLLSLEEIAKKIIVIYNNVLSLN